MKGHWVPGVDKATCWALLHHSMNFVINNCRDLSSSLAMDQRMNWHKSRNFPLDKSCSNHSQFHMKAALCRPIRSIQRTPEGIRPWVTSINHWILFQQHIYRRSLTERYQLILKLIPLSWLSHALKNRWVKMYVQWRVPHSSAVADHYVRHRTQQFSFYSLLSWLSWSIAWQIRFTDCLTWFVVGHFNHSRCPDTVGADSFGIVGWVQRPIENPTTSYNLKSSTLNVLKLLVLKKVWVVVW